MIDASIEGDPMKMTMGIYTAVSGIHAFSGGGEGLGSGPRIPLRPTYTAEERSIVFARQGGICPGCGVSMNPIHDPVDPTSMELDHIEAFSNGGSNDLSNIQGLCRDCNNIKSNLDVEDAAQRLWLLHMNDEWDERF